MINFYLLFETIKEWRKLLIALAIIALILYGFWDKIVWLWEVQQGQWNMYHEHYKK